MKKLKKSWWVPTLIATTIGTAVYLVMPSDPAGPGPAEAQNDVRAVAQSLQLAPDSPRALAAPAAELSPADAERLVVQKRQLRERVASATASKLSFCAAWMPAWRASTTCRAASGANSASLNANTMDGPTPTIMLLLLVPKTLPVTSWSWPSWRK